MCPRDLLPSHILSRCNHLIYVFIGAHLALSDLFLEALLFLRRIEDAETVRLSNELELMLFADDVVDAFASARLGCLVLVFVPEHNHFEQVMRLLQIELVDS